MTTTDYRKAAQSLLDGDLVEHGDLDTLASAAAHALLAIHDILDARLPAPEGMNAVEDEPADITAEPPVGSQVTDCTGDIWERREEGWTLWWPERSAWIADLYEDGALDPWPVPRDQPPLRFTTDEDRKRVGVPEPAPADDGLAEWERELLREGNPRAEQAEAERDEWKARHEALRADVERQDSLAPSIAIRSVTTAILIRDDERGQA